MNTKKCSYTVSDDILNLPSISCYGDDFIFLIIIEIKFEKQKNKNTFSYHLFPT